MLVYCQVINSRYTNKIILPFYGFYVHLLKTFIFNNLNIQRIFSRKKKSFVTIVYTAHFVHILGY